MKELLKKLQLTEKESTLSRALSGGQKRKLSLGIALIGGTKVRTSTDYIQSFCNLNIKKSMIDFSTGCHPG